MDQGKINIRERRSYPKNELGVVTFRDPTMRVSKENSDRAASEGEDKLGTSRCQSVQEIA